MQFRLENNSWKKWEEEKNNNSPLFKLIWRVCIEIYSTTVAEKKQNNTNRKPTVFNELYKFSDMRHQELWSSEWYIVYRIFNKVCAIFFTVQMIFYGTHLQPAKKFNIREVLHIMQSACDLFFFCATRIQSRTLQSLTNCWQSIDNKRLKCVLMNL